MKKKNKYKKESTLNQLITKYKVLYFLGFIGMFILLSMILGFSTYAMVSQNYLVSSKSVVLKFVDDFQHTPPGVIDMPKIEPQDPRMVVCYYLKDDSNNLSYYLAGVNRYETNLYKEYSKEAASIRNYERFEIKKIGGFSNLCYTKKLDLSYDKQIKINNRSVEYIKVCMNIDGEMNSQSQFVRTFILSALMMVVLSIFAGAIMSEEGMKPLKNFVQKQIDFVNDASHELRTPLAVIQSKIENTLATPNKTVYEVSESLVIALNEINRLNKLTSELLTLARNDKDNIAMHFEIVNLEKEIKQIVEPFIEIAQINSRNLSFKGKECYSRVDKDKLKQILIIIIDNAIKYTNENDSIEIELDTDGNDNIIEIKDTGIGIKDASMPHVFERFYREDKARSRETGGNGLGLAIAYTLTHLQKGNITVKHNEPKGTIFTVYFPRVKFKNGN